MRLNLSGIKAKLLHCYRNCLVFFVSQHNKIQFFGYEVANLVLLADTYLTRGDSGERSLAEASAAFFFLIGSACIWRFDKTKRPAMLFLGGTALAFGGVSLMLAGFWLTGIAVVVASLETVRGGLIELTSHVSHKLQTSSPVRFATRRTLRLGAALFGWYVKAVKAIADRHKRLGGFINNRPFLTGALIKAPFRLEFVVRKLFTGDYVGASVGLSWMILGDGGLALNDEKLKQKLKNLASACSETPRHGQFVN